ncbi:hypothetical protein TRFO_29522 [Tritrichomonas foetus]|uniref:SH3 domain-containing protein n=1 Tax=Tritrichomonas foetus TaxID=1144522 RepID=A0A1J4JXM1_9EUKA|nr:hypothetical protein TRFO_29522 [Tritrichomonas foetus]|eukprot:OHT03208.1 hypothetical protein TRFO_29522 [Tritrichomonas foetus]
MIFRHFRNCQHLDSQITQYLSDFKSGHDIFKTIILSKPKSLMQFIESQSQTVDRLNSSSPLSLKPSFLKNARRGSAETGKIDDSTIRIINSNSNLCPFNNDTDSNGNSQSLPDPCYSPLSNRGGRTRGGPFHTRSKSQNSQFISNDLLKSDQSSNSILFQSQDETNDSSQQDSAQECQSPSSNLNNIMPTQAFNSQRPHSFLNSNITMNSQIQERIEIPGFPGSQHDAFTVFSNYINYFFEYFLNYVKKLDPQFDSLEINTKAIDQLQFAYKQNENYKNLLQSYIGNKKKDIQKYNKIVNEKIAKGHCRTVTALDVYKNVKGIRKGVDKPEIISAANQNLNEYKTHVELLKNDIKKRILQIKMLVEEMKKNNAQFEYNMKNLGYSLFKNVQNVIKFEDDFRLFLGTYKIVRYDIQCHSFIPIDMKHPVFAQVSTSPAINVAIPPIYPIAMAYVNSNFVGKYENELTLTKGKIVLLMEPTDQNWVLVMNPFTRATGFAPSKNLVVIGDALGVVLKEYRAKDQSIYQKGDYVAISYHQKTNMTDRWAVYSINNERTEIPKEVVGIIYDKL